MIRRRLYLTIVRNIRVRKPGNRKAQIAPFFIAIIVILLIAVMIAVNLGKISSNKTNTANAADAGALAGATVYDQTLNNLAYTNASMIAEYLAAQASFLIPMNICTESTTWSRFISYTTTMALLAAEYAAAWIAGTDGYQEARNTARQTAFNNAGIDETKARQSGEAYEDWLKRDSRLSQWMSDKEYASESSGSVAYNWNDNVKYGQSGTTGGQNSVEVDVQGPDFPGLIPGPFVLVGMFTGPPIPMFTGCPECNFECAFGLGLYEICLDSLTVANAVAPIISSIGCHVGCCPCPSFWSISVSGGIAYGYYLTQILPSFTSCGMVAHNIILYELPIAFIASIIEDNPEISVSVKRIEPSINLGLWNMRYEKEPGQGIRSRARAKAEGGSVGPIPSEEYDASLIEVLE